MSGRSEAWFAHQREADIKWYNEYTANLRKPTVNQLETIAKIQDRTGDIFSGSTISDASEYINRHTTKKENQYGRY